MRRFPLCVAAFPFMLSSFPAIFAGEAPFPRVWATYRKTRGWDQDFKDLLAGGVGAVAVHTGRDAAELLAAARRHGMKLIISFPEVSEKAGSIPKEARERALMIAGAYQGKAIDRHRFAFTPGSHAILIENPVYDKKDCYGSLGRYFPGVGDPVRAEVVVKTADYDGEQHLVIVPATTARRDAKTCEMRFDLTGVTGDLDHVVLAVYWVCEGTRTYWMFGDAASAAAASTREALARAVRRTVARWRTANGGTFPRDLIVAARYGDECFHVSGHVNSPECSYPLWDYSPSSLAAYRTLNSKDEYPRGKPWIDMFGRRAYADWMYAHHRACADLVRVVKNTLHRDGLGDLPIFRNITRSGVFAVANDHDGSGLDLLVQEFDIAHLDPYPVTAGGYRAASIPRDMSYGAGLARRHGKYLVPWLQAHTYWPERGGLTHPSAVQVSRMLAEHEPHNADAWMWLGWGGTYTFPNGRPAAWHEAVRRHRLFCAAKRTPVKAKLAAVRPYTVRALRDIDGNAPQDAFFTDTILQSVVMDGQWPYDPFEPITAADVNPKKLGRYALVLGELGALSPEALAPFTACGSRCVLFVEGADRFTMDRERTGIVRFSRHATGPNLAMVAVGIEEPIALEAADCYELEPGVTVLARVGRDPCVWRKGRLLFIAARSAAGDTKLPAWLWARLNLAPMRRTIGSLEVKDPRFYDLISPRAKIEILAEGFEWSEGPVWVPEGGYLLWSDIPTNSIYKWKEGEGATLFMRPSGYTGSPRRGGEPGSNGLALDAQGRLVLCEHGDRRVARLASLGNPAGPKVTLAHRYKGKRLNSPNDLVLHSTGSLYFTDPPYGLEKNVKDPAKELDFQGVYRLGTDGTLTLLTDQLTRPNGVAFSPDVKTLYVANSDPAMPVWYAFSVQGDGTLATRRIFHDCRPWREGKPGLPDGMKVDKQGNVFATGPGGVCVFAPDGTRLGTILTTQATANCAWGDDGSTLYITADTYLLRIRTKTKGLGF